MSDARLAESFTAKGGSLPLIDGELFPWHIEDGSISATVESCGLVRVTMTVLVDGPVLLDNRRPNPT